MLCSPEDKDTSTIPGKIWIKLLSKSDWESIDCQVSDSYKTLSLSSFSSFSLPLLYLRPILPPASSGSLTFLNIQCSSSSSRLIKYNTDFLTWHSKPSMYEPRLKQFVPLQDPCASATRSGVCIFSISVSLLEVLFPRYSHLLFPHVSQGCHNKLQLLGWLKTTKTYPLTVLEPTRPKSSYYQCCFFQKAWRENLFRTSLLASDACK